MEVEMKRASASASRRETAMTAAATLNSRRANSGRRASISVDRTHNLHSSSPSSPTAPSSSSSSGACAAAIRRRRMSHAAPMAMDVMALERLKRQRRGSVVFLQWDWEEHRNHDRLCALLASQLSLCKQHSAAAAASSSSSSSSPGAEQTANPFTRQHHHHHHHHAGVEDAVLMEDAPTTQPSS